MYSGKILADILAEEESLPNAQKAYRKNTKALRCKLRMKSVKRVLLCSPFVRGMIMKSGIQSIRPYTKSDKSVEQAEKNSAK
jgi:hypothetical protein